MRSAAFPACKLGTNSFAATVPAQLLTMALAFAPDLAGAITIFAARATIASMDSSVRGEFALLRPAPSTTRSYPLVTGAFLAAVVPKSSRTRFLGSAFVVVLRPKRVATDRPLQQSSMSARHSHLHPVQRCPVSLRAWEDSVGLSSLQDVSSLSVSSASPTVGPGKKLTFPPLIDDICLWIGFKEFALEH